jgi:tol-pal system protein YbgF
MLKIHRIRIVVLGFAVLASGCITTGQDRVAILEGHIASAEKRIAQLEKELGGGPSSFEQDLGRSSMQSRFAETRVKLDELNSKIQALNGKVEEVGFQVDRKLADTESKVAKTDEMIAYNEQRIARLEAHLKLQPMPMSRGMQINPPGSLVTPPPGTSPASPPGSPPMASTPGPGSIAAKPASTEGLSENKLYENGKQAFDQGNFEAARNFFERLIKQHPQSENADNAQFWIAESYYKQAWFEKSALEYQKVIENYPKGNKLQAALLKQGLSFLNMGDKQNAKIILKQLADQYPQSPEADIARARLKNL